MDKQLTYYIDLITRYFAGEVSPGEIQLLSGWIKENDENLKLFNDYRKAWDLVEQSIADKKIDLDDEWSALGEKMKETGSFSQTRVIPLVPEGGNRGTRNIWWRMAASILVIFALAAVLVYYYSRPQMIILTADSGAIEKVLPDGSIITLNKGATIEYPEKFRGKSRQVKLSGEAYFQVVHDKTRPFIVSGENVKVEVLGTTFNVNTQTQEGNLSVILTTGKVSLYFADRSSDKIILLPGEKAEVATESHMIIKKVNTDQNYLAWKTGHIVFDNVPLREIINTLNSVFHSNVVLSDAGLGNCRVTATFDHQSITSVLNVLKGTLDLKVSGKGELITLSGKPCK
jgi:transmembrane sensor